MIYRSWTQRRFVNAGFLFGPFVDKYLSSHEFIEEFSKQAVEKKGAKGKDRKRK